jgi:hypothetical protein
MSAIKPIFREVKQAAIKGFGHSKDKLHQLADNMNDHLDTVVKKVQGQDSFDAPDAPGRGPSPHPYRPNPSRKPAGMSDEDYFDLLESSVHNPNGLEAVLGKYSVPGTSSYVDVAEGKHPPATYFSLGDEWGNIADAHNLTDGDMFEAFNVPFLERMIAEGKPISFSHNPLDFPGSALADELDFLELKGYRFDPTTMQAILR